MIILNGRAILEISAPELFVGVEREQIPKLAGLVVSALMESDRFITEVSFTWDSQANVHVVIPEDGSLNLTALSAKLRARAVDVAREFRRSRPAT